MLVTKIIHSLTKEKDDEEEEEEEGKGEEERSSRWWDLGQHRLLCSPAR